MISHDRRNVTCQIVDDIERRPVVEFGARMNLGDWPVKHSYVTRFRCKCLLGLPSPSRGSTTLADCSCSSSNSSRILMTRFYLQETFLAS